MVAAVCSVKPDSPFRIDRALQHVKGKWIRIALAQFSGSSAVHAHTVLAEHVAFPKAIDLERNEDSDRIYHRGESKERHRPDISLCLDGPRIRSGRNSKRPIRRRKGESFAD